MGTTISIFGWIALVLGIAIVYFINRSRFKRRAVTGMQQFSSFEKAVAITAFEKLVKFIGLILLWGGLFIIAFGWWYTRNEAKKHPIENTKPPR